MDRKPIELLYDSAFVKAADIVATGQEHQPILLVGDGLGTMNVFGLAELSKEAITLVHQRAAQAGVALLIMEAWVAKIDKGDYDESGEYTGPRPSEHPDRTEAVIFNVLTPTSQALAICPIDRTTNTLKKEPLQWLDEMASGEKMEGNMVRNNPPSVN